MKEKKLSKSFSFDFYASMKKGSSAENPLKDRVAKLQSSELGWREGEQKGIHLINGIY